MYLCKASLYAIALWWSVKNTTVLLCTLSLAGVAVCPEVTPLGPNRPSQHNTSVLVGVVCQPCCNEWGVTVPSQTVPETTIHRSKKRFWKKLHAIIFDTKPRSCCAASQHEHSRGVVKDWSLPLSSPFNVFFSQHFHSSPAEPDQAYTASAQTVLSTSLKNSKLLQPAFDYVSVLVFFKAYSYLMFSATTCH